jgi:Na+/melibiose symporter-like transporter
MFSTKRMRWILGVFLVAACALGIPSMFFTHNYLHQHRLSFLAVYGIYLASAIYLLLYCYFRDTREEPL